MHVLIIFALLFTVCFAFVLIVCTGPIEPDHPTQDNEPRLFIASTHN